MLPVDPTRVDSSFFLNGVPSVSPPIPLQAVPPSIGANAPYVLGLIAAHVQQNALANPARAFFSNIVTRNNWNNPEAVLVAATVMEVVDYMLQTQRGDPHQILDGAVSMTVLHMTALFTSQYAHEMAPYLSPGLSTQLQQSLQQFNQLKQEIQMFYQRAAQYPPQPQYPQHYPQPYPQQPQMITSTFNQPGQMAPNMRPVLQPPVQMTTSLQTQAQLNQGHSLSRFGPNVPMQPTATPPVSQMSTGTTLSRFNQPAQTPAPVQTTGLAVPVQPVMVAPATTPVQPAMPAPMVTSVTAAPQQPAVIQTAPTYTPPTVALPDNWRSTEYRQAPRPKMSDGFTLTYPEDPFREIVFANGDVARDAATSGWKSHRTGKQPYHIAYNPERHRLMHLRTIDGLVHEFLTDIIPPTESVVEPYHEHELDTELKQAEITRLNEKSGKTLIDWSKLVDLTPRDDLPYAVPADESEVIEGERTPKIVRTVYSSTDVLSAEAMLFVEHEELAKIAETEPVEFYVESVTPRLTKQDITAAIDELTNCTSFKAVVDVLLRCDREHPEDRVIWDEIDDRLTAQVNRTLNINLSIDWTIDSFCSDIVELEQEVRRVYGADVGDTFTNLAMYIIDTALCVGKQTGAAANRHVVTFLSRTSVTLLPYTFDDLQLRLEGVSAIDRNSLHELHAFVEALFERTTDIPINYAGRYIHTKDDVWLRLDQAHLAADTYLIMRESPKTK